MHSVKISPSVLHGEISLPASKSAVHRAVICAALAEGKSRIYGVAELSNDIRATIECMKVLGASAEYNGASITVDGKGVFTKENVTLDCGESGSTLRFIIPVAAAGGISAEFVGHGKLPERPIGVYTDCLPGNGVACQTAGGLPFRISGKLHSGIYEIPGNISSQFITGLLLALPLCSGDSSIILTTPLQSVGYVQMTTDIMAQFGVNVQQTENGWFIKGNQRYKPCSRYYAEGDWSQAAFFMTAAALGGEITINNLDIDSAQGDKACVEIYRRFGADVYTGNGIVRVKADKLRGINVDARDIPDLVPAIAAAAAFAEGKTVISGAERVRLKECDRLAAMCKELSALGADIEETPDGLVIFGKNTIKGGFAEGHNDHRVVMALASIAAGSEGDIVISDMESVGKSYPMFFEEYKRLGGKADVIMG